MLLCNLIWGRDNSINTFHSILFRYVLIGSATSYCEIQEDKTVGWSDQFPECVSKWRLFPIWPCIYAVFSNGAPAHVGCFFVPSVMICIRSVRFGETPPHPPDSFFFFPYSSQLPNVRPLHASAMGSTMLGLKIPTHMAPLSPTAATPPSPWWAQRPSPAQWRIKPKESGAPALRRVRVSHGWIAGSSFELFSVVSKSEEDQCFGGNDMTQRLTSCNDGSRVFGQLMRMSAAPWRSHKQHQYLVGFAK